jgi:hypothetical protein
MTNWWERGEYPDEIGDIQQPPDTNDTGNADVVLDQSSIAAMQAAPLGEPQIGYDVRSVFDARPINAFDFNFSGTSNVTGTTGAWAVTFEVPLGFRAIPRKWYIDFDPGLSMLTGPSSTSTCSIQKGKQNLVQNQGIIIGQGGEIETFFLCEEVTPFGVSGNNLLYATSGADTLAIVNVWGTLIPVSSVALSFAAANNTKAYST